MWFSGIVVRFIFVLFLISSHLAGHYNTFFRTLSATIDNNEQKR